MPNLSLQQVMPAPQAQATESASLSSGVLPFQIRAAQRQIPATLANKRAREIQEAGWLAMQVHLSDVRLGRCPDVPYHALNDDERDEKQRRALMWVRLGDQAVIDTTCELAAQTVLHEHNLAVAYLPSMRAVARTVARVVLEHLQGVRA